MYTVNDIARKRKVKVVLALNSVVCLLSGLILINTIDSQIIWKIIAASMGFVGFLSLTILTFKELRKIKKTSTFN